MLDLARWRVETQHHHQDPSLPDSVRDYLHRAVTPNGTEIKRDQKNGAVKCQTESKSDDGGGRDQLRKLFDELARTQPETRKFYRERYFTDGKMLIWEYPRKGPEGDQQDFVEVMEIEDGLIKNHRVYWGWFGVRVLERGEHFRSKA
jgi:hypothetical protein